MTFGRTHTCARGDRGASGAGGRHSHRRRGRDRRPGHAAARPRHAMLRDDPRLDRRPAGDARTAGGRDRLDVHGGHRRSGRCAGRGHHDPHRRADRGRARLDAHVEVPAPVAGQASRAGRPGVEGPPPLPRSHHQPGQPRRPARAQRRDPQPAYVICRARLHRAGNADPATHPRRRQRTAVHHAHQRLRPEPLPAHRARAVPQAAGRRRRREGVRDRPDVPQRGRVVQAQSRVHDPRGLPGVRGLHVDARPDPRDRAGGRARRQRRDGGSLAGPGRHRRRSATSPATGRYSP